MLSEEEKEAIEILKKAKEPYYTEIVGSKWIKGYTTALGTEVDNAIDIVLNLIEKQQAEIEEYEWLLDIFNEREYRKKYLAERRKEENKLFSPDADEIYKKYYEQKAEIEKKDKIIDLIAKELVEHIGTCPLDMYSYEEIDCENSCNTDIEYQCWIEYFTNKVEGEK